MIYTPANMVQIYTYTRTVLYTRWKDISVDLGWDGGGEMLIGSAPLPLLNGAIG